ncbi:hypothetical protein GCM10007162_12050 [Ignatzschineria ureiclastica]|nr:hypothetical protein GCM10007162_12050 [Ignatzschineria ureiclastica]
MTRIHIDPFSSIIFQIALMIQDRTRKVRIEILGKISAVTFLIAISPSDYSQLDLRQGF